VLSLIHSQISRTPLDKTSLHAEGEAFDLGWSSSRNNSPVDLSGPPSLDFALYLMNKVKFRIYQLFHLFDEKRFSSNFYLFYDNPVEVATQSPLWYIHFLLVIAFGKSCIGRSQTSDHLPGWDLFVRAMELLLDPMFLCVEQVNSAEILICVALYLQALDFRVASHVYVNAHSFTLMLQGC